jgi:hypothetical protein
MITRNYIGVFFKFHLIVDVEETIMNALYRVRITDQLFKSYVLHVHSRLSNAYYLRGEIKKKHPILAFDSTHLNIRLGCCNNNIFFMKNFREIGKIRQKMFQIQIKRILPMSPLMAEQHHQVSFLIDCNLITLVK